MERIFITCEEGDNDDTAIDCNKIITKGLSQNLDEYNGDYGDTDLNLIGLKYWAGAIWGLISTYSMGELTFSLMIRVLDTYNTRLSNINSYDTDYNDVEGIIVEKTEDQEIKICRICDIFNDLYERHKDSLLDYDHIINHNNLRADLYDRKSMCFETKKYYDLFQIKYNISEEEEEVDA